MDFENCEAFVVPFSLNEKSAWKQVLCYLSKDKTTPVDVACHSRVVSIDRQYYPVERLEVNYIAKWSAISVAVKRWTEQETHYEQQVHYFDRFGEEHDEPGFDYFDAKDGRWKRGSVHFIQSRIRGYSGDASARPWTPREVTVPVTENIPRSMVTGRTPVSKGEEGTYIYHADEEYPLSKFLENGNVAQKKVPDKISYSDEVIKDGTVIKRLTPIKKDDFINHGIGVAETSAWIGSSLDQPGEIFEDSRHEFDSPSQVCQIWYYPVFHVTYEFMGQKYECFVSGYQEGAISIEHTPADTSMKSTLQQYAVQRSDLNSQKKACWLQFPKILLKGFAAFIVILFTLPIVTDIMGATALLFLFFSCLLIAATVMYLCWNNYKEIKNLNQENDKYNEVIINIAPMLQAKKEAILNIVLDDNLSGSEKSRRCEAILNS